jgi:hypothetical protein
LVAASDEQYESTPDDEIALLERKFDVLHKFRKERRTSPRGCFECGDTTHFIADCSKRKKLDSSSNKYAYTKRNDYSKGDNKKKFQKMMSRACAALSDDSSSSEEDEKVKHKSGDFTGLCIRGKPSRHISDSDVSDVLSSDSLSLRVVELENTLCNQDKLLCKVFGRTKSGILNLKVLF